MCVPSSAIGLTQQCLCVGMGTPPLCAVHCSGMACCEQTHATEQCVCVCLVCVCVQAY